jgi:hypothetical protein
LAGNFGFEKGHLEVSKACAESVLLPAVRDADPDAVLLADGFSCRTQVHELDSGGREAVHLAELLDRARRGESRSVPGDLNPGDRVPLPSTVARAGALTAVAAVVGGAITLAARTAARRAARRVRRRRSRG